MMQKRKIFYALRILTFLFLFYSFFLSTPADFPTETIFQVKQGDSLRGVSLRLKNAHIIRSRLAFEAFVILFGREKGVVSADYYFENKLSVWNVAKRISKGEHHMAPIAVTIPEGFNALQIADTFTAKLINFNKSKFLLKASDLEGSLFPDTYFFFRTDTEESVLASMKENFNKKMKILRPLIEAQALTTKRTEKEILVMASIIEKEAKGDADREFISGILWKRRDIGMPLQADAAPETYKVKGLPKSPICNPGLAAIKAAIHPQKSSYLYYLHDKKGGTHYAKSFTEHLQNIQKYLR